MSDKAASPSSPLARMQAKVVSVALRLFRSRASRGALASNADAATLAAAGPAAGTTGIGVWRDGTADGLTPADLAAQMHLLLQLVRTTSQGYWFIDDQGVSTDVNPAMCELLGRPAAEIVGRSVFDFFAGDEQATMRREIAARLQGAKGHYEIGIVRPDGTRRYCVNNATPLRDSAGRPIGSVGLWTDITERRDAELALRRYEMVTNSLTDMVSVIDADETYRMVNDEWCRRTGITREQALGSQAFAVLPEAARAARREALDDCLRTHQLRVVRGPMVLAGLDSSCIETTYSPYADDRGGTRWVVMVSRDVTEQEEARRRLAESTDYLRTTLNATGDAIFASDALTPSEPVRFVNDQMLQMWGLPPELRASLTPGQIMAAAMPLFADPDKEARVVAELIASNTAHESHVALRDGRTLLRRCIPAHIGDRTVRVWSFRDITAGQRALQWARAGEAEQRALLDAFPGFITRVDDTLTYTYVNERVAQRLGTTPQHMLGRNALEVIDPALVPWMRSQVERLLAGHPVQYERVHHRGSGEPLVDQVTLATGVDPVHGRRVIYSFGVDITDRKRAERAWLAARDEADRANRAKSEFLSRMSHELRTPLNAILGFSQIMERSRELGERHQRWVGEIIKAGRHLLDLVNEVLDLARVESGRFDVASAPVGVAALLGECVDLMRPLALGAAVHLDLAEIDADLRVQGDRTRLKQVLLNLLSNAVKYNCQGGEVAIECERLGERAWLRVRDTGPGLDEQQQARLFVPFERLAAGSSHVEGTGIGLALAKRLVELMHGQIGVDSRPGAGSTFWVALPVAGPAGAESVVAEPVDRATAAVEPGGASPSGGLGSAGGPVTVLSIEDDSSNRRLLDDILAARPAITLLHASHPVEGLALARRHRPALVLLDIHLPDMDGFEVLGRLRGDPATRATAVLALSANAMPDDVARGRQAGFDDYLTKPVDVAQLLDHIDRALAR